MCGCPPPKLDIHSSPKLGIQNLTSDLHHSNGHAQSGCQVLVESRLSQRFTSNPAQRSALQPRSALHLPTPLSAPPSSPAQRSTLQFSSALRPPRCAGEEAVEQTRGQRGDAVRHPEVGAGEVTPPRRAHRGPAMIDPSILPMGTTIGLIRSMGSTAACFICSRHAIAETGDSLEITTSN